MGAVMSYQKTEFETVFQREVGGFYLVLGILKRSATTSPLVYAAALSERELREEKCGYGWSEPDAVADLFRLLRPDMSPLPFPQF